MNNLYTIMDQLSVSPSAQRVYETALGNEALSSSDLIQRTNMPRPTVMAALKELRDAGLCIASEHDGRSLSYQMAPPQALKSLITGKQRALGGLIESIDKLTVSRPKTLVQTAHDQKELVQLLDQALYCKSRYWRIMAPKENAIRCLPGEYIREFKRVRAERQIEGQTLWEGKFRDQSVTLLDTLMRKPRYIDAAIPSLLLSFDDSVLTVTGSAQLSASLTTDAAATQSFNILFDLAWQSCREKV